MRHPGRLLLILFLVSLLAFGASDVYAGSEKSDYNSARKAYRKVLVNKDLRTKRHNWEKAIRLFESFRQKHPNSAKGDDALYNIGMIYYQLSHYSGRKEDLEASIKNFRKLQRIYTRSNLADDAQYQIGIIYLENYQMPIKASVEFEKIISIYSNGDMVSLAQEKLVEIQKQVPQASKNVKDGKPSGNSKVKEIKVWSNQNYTKVAIYLDRPVGYEPHLLSSSDKKSKASRLYLDLKPSELSGDLNKQIPVGDGLLTRIRVGQYDPKTVRVVLDATSIYEHSIIPYTDPPRIVIDVFGTGSKVSVNRQNSAKGVSSSDLAIRRIVIDPGHGGKDPGAVGPRGTKEKDIVLEISKLVAKEIENKLGLEAVLTRTKDKYLSLDERNAIANAKGADLFISIHTNASTNKKASGIETYHLNTADGEASQRAAARENGLSWSANVPDLDYILADLTINFNSPYSARLASLIQTSMIKNLGKQYKSVRDLGVHTALFYVLVGAKCPSALIEVSFISNSQEESRLRSQKYRKEVASSIVKGIQKYIKDQETIALSF